MISFEEMPPSAQKAYKVTNVVRKGAMFIGWVVFVLLYIFLIVDNNENNGITDWLFGPLLGAGMLSGIIHGEFLYKKVFRTFTVILFLIALSISAFFAMIFGYIGFIFLIVHTILFFKKKPLVYSFEHKYFLETQKAQEEMTANAYNELLNVTHSNDAVIKIQQLKEMMEQGTITEEEYNQKKAELLERI